MKKKKLQQFYDYSAPSQIMYNFNYNNKSAPQTIEAVLTDISPKFHHFPSCLKYFFTNNIHAIYVADDDANSGEVAV